MVYSLAFLGWVIPSLEGRPEAGYCLLTDLEALAQEIWKRENP